MLRSLLLKSLVLIPVLLAGPVQASLVDWQIDSNSSWIRLTINDQNIQVAPGQFLPAWLRDQGVPGGPVAPSWTDSGKRLAALEGTISSNYVEGSSIQFTSGSHNSNAVESGSFLPNRTTWDGTNFDTTQQGTPTAFAADLTLQGAARLAFLNIYNVNLDFDGTSTLSGGAGTWSGSGNLSVGAESGSILDFDAQPSLITLSDSRTALAALMGAAALGTDGSLTINDIGGLNRELLLTYDVPFVVVINGLPLNARFDASIRAYATVPEPASAALAGMAACMMALRRRRVR